MIRMSEWTVSACGKDYRAKPLTVRQRLALSEDLSSERARVAAEDARLAGMDKAQTAEYIGEARRKGAMTSALFLDAYSLQGAIRILTVVLGGVDTALEFSEKANVREMTRVCLEALGIDTDQLDAENEKPAPSGNA